MNIQTHKRRYDSTTLEINSREAKRGGAELLSTAKLGKFKRCLELIEEGAEQIQVKDSTGTTPLHACCNWETSSNELRIVVERLLYEGASIKEENNKGKTPLYFAIKNDHSDLVKILLRRGEDPDAQFGVCKVPAISFAISQDSFRSFRVLQIYGADPTSTDTKGRTPLMYACKYNQLHTAHFLFHSILEVNVEAKNGATALFYATKGGNIDLVRELLGIGASPLISVKRKNGFSCNAVALSISMLSRTEAMVLAFLQHQSAYKFSQNDLDGFLLNAVEEGSLAVVQAILKKLPTSKSLLIQSKNPLSEAYLRGREEILKLLFEKHVERWCLDEAISQALIFQISDRKLSDTYFKPLKRSLKRLFPHLQSIFEFSSSLSHLEEILLNNTQQLLKNEGIKIACYLGSNQLMTKLKQEMDPVKFEEQILQLSEHFDNWVLSINPLHYTLDIPKPVQTSLQLTWSIYKLDRRFTAINFQNPSLSNYRDISELKSQENPVSLRQLNKGFDNFLTEINTNPGWQESMERISRAFDLLDDEEVEPYLIEFALIGLQCRYAFTELHNIANILEKKDPVSLSGKIYDMLRKMRRELLILQAQDDAPEYAFEVHYFTHLVQLLGKTLGIVDVEEMIFQQEDLFQPTEISAGPALSEFLCEYTPKKILDSLGDTVFSLYKEASDPVIDWFKDNTPAYWKLDLFKKIEESISQLSENEAIIKLKKEHPLLVLDPRILNLKEKLERARALDYLSEGVFEFNSSGLPIKFKRSAVHHLARSLKILQ